MSASAVPQVEVKEAVQLGAVDGLFYSRFFFPKTVRQASPQFHRDVWDLFFRPTRYKSMEIFRGGAKTSTARLLLSHRVAYGLSRTQMVVGKSLDHAMYGIDWLKSQVEHNTYWAQSYGLRKGRPWTGSHIEIVHEVLGFSIQVLAFGISGSIRGVNLDDWRPDFILGDDIIDEEMVASPMQRQKTEDLWFGALRESLAPRSESPHACQMLLGTPLDEGDINELCQNDLEFDSLRISIFDKEGHSAWPERWTTEELHAEKAAFIRRNQLSLWLREKECVLSTRETSDFDAAWLKYWDVLPERHLMAVVIAIDPVPPPTELQISKGLRDKDYECIAVGGYYQGKVFLIEYAANRGHNPDWTIAKFFEFAIRWNPRLVKVEGVAYQQTLKWLLEQEMQKRRRYYVVDAPTDRRKKRDRIVQGLQALCAHGNFYCRREHVEFIEQFTRYPRVPHDDVVESVAVAAQSCQELDVIEGEVVEDESGYEALPQWRALI